MRGAPALLFLLPVLAGCAQTPATPATTWSDWNHATLEELAAARVGGHFPAFVTYVVEAAALGGLDPNTWPADHPVARDIPAGGPGYLSTLRPLYARLLSDPSNATLRAEVVAAAMGGHSGGQFGDAGALNDDMAAMQVLTAAGSRPESGWADAVASLARNQTGGWSWRVGGEPETDMTGLALDVLAGVSGGLDAVDRGAALASLDAARRDDGGYGLDVEDASNCDSTVWAIRAHLALDEPVADAAWSYLASLRTDGGWSYQPGEGRNTYCALEIATLFAVAQQAGLPVPAAFSFEP